MPITAQSVVRRCVDALQDETSIRWPLRELVRYLNDGQREIAMYRPDSMVTNATVALTSGLTKQSIPSGGAKLIEVVRNTSGNKRPIRQTKRELMDASVQNWHTAANTANEILHFMFDPLDPKIFYVYPPAGSASSVELVFGAYPTDIAQPAENAYITSAMTDADVTIIAGTISVQDIYAGALQDYILFRAWSKDAEYAANSARADKHYGLFANALGIEAAATQRVAPTSPDKATA